MSFRNNNLKKQIKASFIYKILAIAASFLLVRYMIEYLGMEQYGIWSVLLTFINFVLFFDLGIVNGVKNKVSISLSKQNYIEARQYVSTGYAILLLGVSVVYMIFFIFSSLINWQNIFNTNIIENYILNQVILLSLFFILLNFVLSTVIALYNATQNTSLIVLNQLVSQGLSLLFITFLIQFTNSNIMYLSFMYGSSLVFSNIVISVFFYKKNKKLLPSTMFVDKTKIKSILTLGFKFFILQLTIFIILSTDKILITQLLGPSYVTSYDILFKYFSIITVIHTIINTPLWSMYTEAYQRNDYIWIESTLLKMIKLMIIYILLAFIMYFLAPMTIILWIGDIKLGLTNSNYMYMIILTLLLSWYSIFAYFTNGINKTRIQLYTAIVGALVNIPMSIFFVKYLNMELNGVLLATIISLSFFGIFGPIQAFYEIHQMKIKNRISNDKL